MTESMTVSRETGTEKKSDRPILITGGPRSGTTFVGRVFESSNEIFEIYEPFNDEFTYNLDLPSRFFRITDEQTAQFKPRFDRMMSLADRRRRLALLPRGAVDRFRSTKDLAGSLALKKLAQNPSTFLSARRLSIKDPLAFYSSDWIAKHCNAAVIVMLRHPCGVISSFEKLGWDPETPSLVDTPLPLSEGLLDDDIARWRANRDDRIGALILQWKIFAQASLDFHTKHPEWMFVLHRDVCNYPNEMFKLMFEHAELDIDENVGAEIEKLTEGQISGNTNHTQHSLVRNSSLLSTAWKGELSAEVQERILKETEDLWDKVQATFQRFERLPDAN